MAKILSRVAAIALLAASAAGCASPGGVVGSIPQAPLTSLPSPVDQVTAPAANALPTSAEEAVLPAGYVSFCLRFADQCVVPPNAQMQVALTPTVWQGLKTVNSQVNGSIWPEDDVRHYGRAEYWTIPTDGYGDCEDYALAKRKMLLALGLSPAALRIAIVITPDEERHAVLTVVTDKGDYVLDNLNNTILPWDQTGFTWVERQAPTSTLSWVSLFPANRMLAARAVSGGVVTGAVR